MDTNLKKFPRVQMWSLVLAFLMGVVSTTIWRCCETRPACNCDISSPEAFQRAKELHAMHLQEIEQRQKLETQRRRHKQREAKRQNERLAVLKNKGLRALRHLLDDD